MRTSPQFGTCPPGRENSWRKAHRKSALWTDGRSMAGEQHFKPDRIQRQTAEINFNTLKVTGGSRVCAGEVRLQLPAQHPSAVSVSPPTSTCPSARKAARFEPLGEATSMLITYESLFTCGTDSQLAAQMNEPWINARAPRKARAPWHEPARMYRDLSSRVTVVM